MDAQEIRALLGKSIFERAQKYRKRILQSSCTTNEDGVRHLTALVQGGKLLLAGITPHPALRATFPPRGEGFCSGSNNKN